MTIAIILIIIAAVAKAVMDTIAKGQWSGWWNKDESWRWKWDYGYYLHTGGFKERFPGSTTIFVFLTDGWHLFQFIFLNCLIAGIILWSTPLAWYWDFLIISVGFRVVFEGSYRVIQKHWT